MFTLKFKVQCLMHHMPVTGDPDAVIEQTGSMVTFRFQGKVHLVKYFDTGLSGQVVTVATDDGGYFYTDIPSSIIDLSHRYG